MNWISFDSAQPKFTHEYIVYIVGYSKEPIITIAKWGSHWTHTSYGNIDDHVTHFMELPKAPIE